MATDNPAPFFARVVGELSPSEWLRAMVHWSGVSPDVTDPPSGHENQSNASWTAHLERSGQLAGATHTTCLALLQAHDERFSNDPRGYLLPVVEASELHTAAQRLEKLARGSVLRECRTRTRNPAARVLCYKMPLQPKPEGMLRTPFISWQGTDPQTATLKVFYENANGNETSSTSPAVIAAAINAMPEGYRALQWNIPSYTIQIDHAPPGGGTAPWVFALLDGNRTGDFPGVWLEHYAAGIETSLGALLDSLLGAGLETLDLFVGDFEFEFDRSKLGDYQNNFPHPSYRTSTGSGSSTVWFNEHGRNWHDDLRYRVANDKAAWAAANFCPNLTGIQTAAFDSEQHMAWCGCVFEYQALKMKLALEAVLKSRFPNLIVMNYDSRPKAPRWRPVTHKKRFGSPKGGGIAQDRTGGNLYFSNAGNPGATAEAMFAGGVQTVTTDKFVNVVTDLEITLAGHIAASRLPCAPLVTPRESYPLVFPNPNDPLLYAHTLAAAAVADPCLQMWHKNNTQNSLASQNLIVAAIQEAEQELYGIVGTPLETPPRSGWNVTAPTWNPPQPCVVEILTINDAGQSTIKTLTVPASGVHVWSERENVRNWAPELEPLADDTATVGVEFTKAVLASSPTAQGLSYRLVEGPTWLSIDAETGVLSGTPTSGGSLTVTVEVADDDPQQPLATEGSFTLTISGTPNNPPIISPISGQTATEGVLYQLTVSAEDPEDDDVTFTLPVKPTGMTITPLSASSARLDWTPSETQGGAAHLVTVRATDEAGAASERTFSITVAEVNAAPVIGAPSNLAGYEYAQLSQTITAADPDHPAQSLTYVLVAPEPGMTINPNTGLFAWTPGAGTGGQAYLVTVRVFDSGSPSTSSQTTFNLTVWRKNTAPTLAAIGDRDGTAGVLLSFTASASDADLPAQTLTFSLIDAPSGAAIDGSTGVFSWVPAAAGDFTFKVRVTDNGQTQVSGAAATADPLFDEEEITLTIAAVNQPPVIAPLADQTAREGVQLSFTVAASDPDVGQSLSYAVSAGPGSIDSEGLYTYTPAVGSAPDQATVTITVSDDDDPPQTASRSFLLTVVADLTVATLGEFTAQEGVPLEFQAELTAPGVWQPRFSLVGAPAGAEISDEGAFQWTPAVGQAGSYSFAVRAEELSNPAIADEETLTVQVQPAQQSTPRTPKPRRASLPDAIGPGPRVQFRGGRYGPRT